MKKHVSGFTLIELLIVVAIIGILAAIAVPNFLNAQVRAKVARVQSDHRAISQALEAYRVDNNTFTDDAHFNNLRAYTQLKTPVDYLSITPNDPFTDGPLGGMASGGSEVPSLYQIGTGNANQLGVGNPNTKNIYLIMSNGPDRQEQTQPISTFPMLNPNVPTFYIAFEATNGLYSRGDIWRFGGAPLPNQFKEKVSFNY